MNPNTNPSQLRWSEWAITGALLLFVLSLVIIAKIQASRFSVGTLVLPPPVEVIVTGAVKKPGTYPTQPGTPLREVLRKAKPLRLADVKSIDPDFRVQAPMKLEIPVLTHISIIVRGAVENPGPLTVPAGTKISDLKKYVRIRPEADAVFLKKRRMISEGETVVVP